jgi:hypothetical protein
LQVLQQGDPQGFLRPPGLRPQSSAVDCRRLGSRTALGSVTTFPLYIFTTYRYHGLRRFIKKSSPGFDSHSWPVVNQCCAYVGALDCRYHQLGWQIKRLPYLCAAKVRLEFFSESGNTTNQYSST